MRKGLLSRGGAAIRRGLVDEKAVEAFTSAGGLASAAALTDKERSARAKKAVAAREAKRRKRKRGRRAA